MMNNQQQSLFTDEGSKAGEAFAQYTGAFLLKMPSIGTYDVASQQVVMNAAANAFQAYYQHVLDLAVDKYGITPEDEEESGRCAMCWCHTCVKRDDCSIFNATDGITPPPCAECDYQERRTPLMPPYQKCMDYQSRDERDE